MKRAKAMGKRRMIFGNISTSKKFNGLKTDQARLLYLMMYPHSDDFGRMEAEPSAIKMIAVPGLDWSFANIQEYMDDLSTSKLISLYENNGSKYFEFVAFDDHQVFERQRVGKYPEPLEQSESSKNDLNSLKISKVKISKVKESKDKGIDIPPHLLEIWKDFELLRKAKRQPLTNRAIKNILETLSGHTQDVQIKMIDQSITCGYTGIFELKDNYKQSVKKSNLDLDGKNYREGT